MKRPCCLAQVWVLVWARMRSPGLLSPGGWIPSSLVPQGIPACSSPALAARLESPSVTLCSGSAGEMCREDGLPLQCTAAGRFPWARRVGIGGSFPAAFTAAFPNPCPLRTVISLAELCGELVQSLATPASCKVSLGCPCSVPVSSLWMTEFSALDRPQCTASTGETWLETSATAAPPCLGKHPAVVGEVADGAGEGAQPGTRAGRLLPRASWLSPHPREAAGVPTAASQGCAGSPPVPTAGTTYGCWTGTGSLEPKGSQRPLLGLWYHCASSITSESKRCVNAKE